MLLSLRCHKSVSNSCSKSKALQWWHNLLAISMNTNHPEPHAKMTAQIHLEWFGSVHLRPQKHTNYRSFNFVGLILSIVVQRHFSIWRATKPNQLTSWISIIVFMHIFAKDNEPKPKPSPSNKRKYAEQIRYCRTKISKKSIHGNSMRMDLFIYPKLIRISLGSHQLGSSKYFSIHHIYQFQCIHCCHKR